jgi:hypothetical protein
VNSHGHGLKILAKGINVQTTNQQVHGNGPIAKKSGHTHLNFQDQ